MPDGRAGRQLGLLDYGHRLWARRFTVVLALIVGAAGAVAYDMLKTPEYSATASVLLVSQSTSASGASSSLSPSEVPTQLRLFNSTAVRLQAAKYLGSVPPNPTVTQDGVTTVADVKVTSTDAAFAAKAANAYVKAYITWTQNTFLAQAQSAEAALQTQIDALQIQIAAVEQQLASSSAASSGALTARLGQLAAQQQALQSQVTQIQVSAAQAPSGGQPVQPALAPKTPSSPKPVVDITIGVLLGLLAGLAIALLREFLDDRIKTQDDLDHVAMGLPTLGVIPRLQEWKNRKKIVLVTAERPNSPPAEAYRGLRTAIQFVGLEQSTGIIEITSPSAGDGKTTTAANVAVSMAEAGKKVLLVGCDLRKPRIHDFFSLSNAVGFTSVLINEASPQDACLPVPTVNGLWVMPSGPIPPNPSELLGSQQSRALFKTLSKTFDTVIVDAPPILPVTDAAVVATIADAVLVVCAAGGTTGRDFTKAMQLLERVDAPLLGLVLNNASASDAYVYYRYGERYGSYGYGYGSDSNRKSDGSKSSRWFSRNKRSSGSRGGAVAQMAVAVSTKGSDPADRAGTTTSEDPDNTI